MSLRVARTLFGLGEADARRLRAALVSEGMLRVTAGNRYVAAA